MEAIQILLEKIKSRRQSIYDWLSEKECCHELPLYSSVDLRDSGFKVSVVDTNLFPAGFNNLCEHGLETAAKEFKKAILKRVPHCKSILILAEEHTRNTFYLENVRILQETIEKAGFFVCAATFLDIQIGSTCEASFIEFETASGRPLRIYSVDNIVKNVRACSMKFDLIIMNNDLTKGIPEVLRETRVPIYPSINAGWHSRQKSRHFQFYGELIQEFSKLLNLDPWLFSCLDSVVASVDITQEKDRETLAEAAEKLFERIQAKYKEHGLQEKPFVFLKSDAGTYGMGVMSFENPEAIIHLNKYGRKNLHKGKGSQVIDRFLLQEGVSTRHRIESQVAEVSIYQVDNRFVGGFYRTNQEKSDRDNLNSKGMGFYKMCPVGSCGESMGSDIFDLYKILARIAGIAAHREIIQLEAQESL